MAAVLRRHGATACERDAIRCLIGRGFRDSDIAALAGDAMYEARQDAVTSTMARSR